MTDLPTSVLDEATRLTKLARAVPDPDEQRAYLDRRESLLNEYNMIARVREEAEGAVLVCYPQQWVDDDGVVRPGEIEDTDQAIERRLAGRGEQGDFRDAEAHNRRVVEQVDEEWGEPHRANAEAFADFMGNHYARRIETATATEIEEFLAEYYPRNVWPTPEQAALLEESLRYTFEVIEEPYPLE